MDKSTTPSAQQTAVKNLQSEGNITIGDIIQTTYYAEPYFSEPDLDQYKPPEFESPKIAYQLIEIINEQRLLVLGGDPGVNKEHLAKHLAWLLINEPSKASQKLEVKEWYRGLHPRYIDVELQKEKKNTVFLLTQASPQSLASDLSEVKKAATSYKHYVIITTKTPFAVWNLPESVRSSFWHDLSSKDVADSEKLKNELTQEEALHNWYYNELSSREQLLALGLSFFAGLFDDQFFAALEKVVESAWQRRDTSLRALDYCDLDKLSYHFTFDERKPQGTRVVEIKFFKHLLFKVAWKSHRRQILAALPILANLAKKSIRSYEWELYGTPVRCKQLYKVIIETISDIALIASDAVEDTLLKIVADQDIEVQTVAALAMVLWRNKKRESILNGNKNINPDQELFQILQSWQKNARIISLVDSILKEQGQAKSEEPVDYIRATIALTVGYAALYDPPDELSPKICELLKQLTGERNKLVRGRVLYTLPLVVRQHIVQLRSILHDMLHDIDDLIEHLFSGIFSSLAFGVARSLAFAYQFKPEEVLKTLNSWNSECKKIRSQEKVNIAKVTPCEALRVTVALTYGEIECDQSVGELTVQRVFEHLQNILSEELHPLVRKATLFAIGRQAYRAFKQVEPQLQNLVTQITSEERQIVAEILTQIYLEERANLPGGDRFIEVSYLEERVDLASGDRSTKVVKERYPVWLNSPRPLTTVEQAILRWAKNDQNAMAQQVATHVSANFASRLEQEEERQIKRLREGRDLKEEPKPVYATPIVGGQPPQDWYLGKLVPWLATLKAQDYRTAIRNLLPEGLRQHKLSQEIMNFVLRKWEQASDNDLNAISKRLKPGLWLAKNLRWLMPLGGVGALALVGLVVINLRQAPEITESPTPEPKLINPTTTRAVPPNDPKIVNIIDNATVSDIDSPNFNTGNLTVRFLAGSTSDDHLGIRDQDKNPGKISVDDNAVFYGSNEIGRFEGGKGAEPLVVRFNYNATVEAVQTLVRNVTYQNVADSPNLGIRTVEFQVTDDANLTSRPLTKTILVTRENKAPTVTVPDHLEANESVPLKISGISFNDPDSTKNFMVTLSVNKGTITVSDSVPNGLKASDIKYNSDAKTVRFIGSPEKIKTTLADPDAITYVGTDDSTFSITVNDGGLDIPEDVEKTLVWPPNVQVAKTSSKDFQITVNPKNKPPILTIPEPSKIVNENEDLTIGSISVDDPDTLKLTVKLSVKHGTLTVKTDAVNGLTADAISNNKARSVTLAGDRDKIKATLADPHAIIYRGDQDFNGNDSLTIDIDDNGRGKTEKLNIMVNHVRHPPILGTSASWAPPTPIPPQIDESRSRINPMPSPTLRPAPDDTSPKNNQEYIFKLLAYAKDNGGLNNETQILEVISHLENLPKPNRYNHTLARDLNKQGLNYLQNGQIPEAVNVLKNAYLADLGDVEIINNLGYSYLIQDDLNSAEHFVLLALTLAPRRVSAWTNLGQIYARKADKASATACFINAYRFSKNRAETTRFFLKLEEKENNLVQIEALREAGEFARNHFSP